MTELDPDVLVMDLSMPGCGGLAALGAFLARKPGQKVLIASAHADAIIAERAPSAGAAATCASAAPDELLKAVGLVAAASVTSTRRSPPPCRQADRPGHPAEALTDKGTQRLPATGPGALGSRGGRDLPPQPQYRWHAPLPHQAKAGVQNMAELAMAAVRSA